MKQNNNLEDHEIIFKYLGQRARRFVEKVRKEWDSYNNASTKAVAGCLHRDEVRYRLERLAYYRYGKNLVKQNT